MLIQSALPAAAPELMASVIDAEAKVKNESHCTVVCSDKFTDGFIRISL